MANEAIAAGPVGAAKRRRWPWIALGALALLVAAVLAAPSVASGWIAGAAERSFARDHRGRLEIEGLSLAWFSGQRVENARLLDPDGREVARVSADLPPLASLVRGGGRRIGSVSVHVSADLVADDAGVSNLERSLEPTEDALRRASEPSAGGEPTDIGARVRELDVEVGVAIDRLTWSDKMSRALGRPFEVAAVAALRVAPGGRIECSGAGRVASEGDAPVTFKVGLFDAFGSTDAGLRSSFEASATAQRLPSGLIDALAGTDGLVAAALGDRFDVDVRAQGTLAAGAIDARIAGDSGALEIACELRDRVLTLQRERGIVLASQLAAERVDALLARLAPEGLAIAREGSVPFELVVDSLKVDLGAILDSPSTDPSERLARALAATELSAHAALGGWRVEAGALGLAEPLVFADPMIEIGLGFSDTGQLFSLDLASSGIEMSLATTFDGSGVLRGAPDGAATLRLPVALVEALAAPALPPGASIALGSKFGIAVRELELPLGPVLAGESPATLLDRAHVVAKASIASAEYRDASDPANPARFELSDVALDVRAVPDGAGVPVEVSGSARVGAKESLAFSLAVPRLASWVGRARGGAAALEARATLDGVGWIADLAPGEAAFAIRELTGGALEIKLALASKGEALLDELAADGSVSGAHFDLHAAARLERGVARVAEGPRGCALRLRPTRGMLDRFLAPSLPEGASLDFADANAAIAVAVSALALPLDAWMPADAAEPAPFAGVLRRTTATARIEIPKLVYRQPPVAGGGAPVPIEVESLAVDARVRAGEPAALDVAGSIGGAASGAIRLHATCADIGAFAEAAPAARPGIAFDAELRALPTALADALAGQRGLFVDVLGSTMDATVAGAWPSDALRATLRSPTTEVEIDARFEDGRLVAGDAQGLRAKLPLTPLANERVVGRLVPLFVDLAKPEGAAPAALDVTVFSLPLDGDLSKLDGRVRLDLGEVAYGLLPGLGDALSAAGVASLATKRARIPPLEMEIVKGVVRYERLPIAIGGRELVFRGKFDLAKLELDFKTDVPLELLGKDVAKALDKVRDFVEPGTEVPITLRGSWRKPKVRIDEKFTDDLLEKAAKGALERGLRDLLGDKKKKDGGG